MVDLMGIAGKDDNDDVEAALLCYIIPVYIPVGTQDDRPLLFAVYNIGNLDKQFVGSCFYLCEHKEVVVFSNDVDLMLPEFPVSFKYFVTCFFQEFSGQVFSTFAQIVRFCHVRSR